MVKIQKMDFLIAIYIFCIAVAELMGGKTFPITKIGDFQLNASVAIFVIPLLYSSRVFCDFSNPSLLTVFYQSSAKHSFSEL